MPFGTRLVVTNLNNGRQVEVRVNDRGPFAQARILDVSRGAARVLDMVTDGVVPVRIEVRAAGAAPHTGRYPVPGKPLSAGQYTVQVGSFIERDRAVRLQQQLAPQFPSVFIGVLTGAAGPYYRVRIGHFPSRQQAQAFARNVAATGVPVVIMPVVDQ